MAVKKIQKNRMNGSGTFDIIHYETDASQVLMADGTTAEDAIGGKEASGAAAQALTDAKNYTDEQISIVIGSTGSHTALYATDCGLVGDGSTDNLSAFNDMVAAYPDRTIIFSDGTFCFSGKLVFEHCYIVLDNAELKLTSSDQIDRFIEVHGEMIDSNHPIDDMFIRGNGRINANMKAANAIGVSIQKGMIIDGIKIGNFTESGFSQKYDDSGQSYEFTMTNCMIYQAAIQKDAIGINACADSEYRNIVILNCGTGVKVTAGGNLFDNIHAWIYDFEQSDTYNKLEGSVCFNVQSGGNRFSNCYIDTYQIGFYFPYYGCTAMINNVFWWINGSTWPDGLVPTMFKSDVDGTKIMASNIDFRENYYGTLLNSGVDWSSSSFANVMSNEPDNTTIRQYGNFEGHFKLRDDIECNGQALADLGAISMAYNDSGRRVYFHQVSRDGRPLMSINEWYGNQECRTILTSVDTPEEDYDAVNKIYVDTAVEGKQNAITGAEGQVVGFDADGKPVAQDAPSSIPAGGTTGQMLMKLSDNDGDVGWGDAASGIILDSIYIDAQPTKTDYYAGEVFDPAGMVIKANYSNGTVVIIEGITVTGYTYDQSPLAGGTTGVTITYTEGGVTKTAEVTISVVILVLNDLTWEKISEISANSQGANYWSVGDTKAVTLSGTVGTLDVSGTYYVYILGFDHNAALEGKGIQFGTFKTAQTDGVDVCLVDSKYNITISDGTKYFNLNHWGGSSFPYNTNYGGWAGCDARYDILGSTDQAPSGYGSTPTTDRVGYDASTTTATNPVANTLMAAFPSDLRAVMKPITKYTDAVGNSSNVQANVKASVDYLPLLAEFEIFGARNYANTYEQNYQAQYAYYSAGNSKVRYKHNATGTTAYWWERSPCYGAAFSFCRVITDGNAGGSASRTSFGLAPAFMV